MHQAEISGPFEFIIGTNDFENTAYFLQAFGFDKSHRETIDQQAAVALYGNKSAVDQLVLSRDETDTVLRLVNTDAPAVPMTAFAARGHGVDFYTRDIEGMIDDAHSRGGSRPSSVSWTIDTGRHLTEARIISPDESFTVFGVSYSPGGIPTVLDNLADEMISEATLTSWIVPPDLVEAEFAFWSEKFGYRNIRRTMLDENAMIDLMKLPHPAAMGCSMFADSKPRCPVDLLWYPGQPSDLRNDWPLRPGLFALGFKANSEQSLTGLSELSTPVLVDHGRKDKQKVLSGRSPGGIRYQISLGS